MSAVGRRVLLVLQYVNAYFSIFVVVYLTWNGFRIAEDNCPNSYAYAYDESSGTALWTCSASLEADYTITFCPPPGE